MNVHDVEEAAKLVHEDDDVLYGDSAYLGIAQRIAAFDDEHLKSMKLQIAKRPSSLKTTDIFKGMNWDKFIEHRKSAVRCTVEQAFLIVKRDFGYRKVAYRGLKII